MRLFSFIFLFLIAMYAPASAQVKISQMPNGGTLESTDQIPIARSGNNYQLLGSTFRDASNLTGPTLSSGITNSYLTSLGTIGTGIWNGSVIGSTYGGTGANNGTSTFTYGGNTAFLGAYTFTGTLTGDTSVTFPTSGTLLTSGATSGVYLGTSSSATNPQIAADATTGLYTAGAGKVDISVSNSKIAEFSSTGQNVTGNIGFSKLVQGTTSLYPSFPSVVTTTANATNGSASITVASATGIVNGQPIVAPPFVPSGAYVTNVSGTTVTMSAKATHNETGATITFGVPLYDPNNSILTNTFGAHLGVFGEASQGNTWANSIFLGSAYFGLGGGVQAISTNGSTGVMGATRASDAGFQTSAIGVSALALNDDTTYGSYPWAYYGACNQNAGATGGCAGMELDTANFFVGNIAFDPYATPPLGANSIAAFASGAGYPYQNDPRVPNPVSVGVIIYDNGAKIDTGLMIRDASLVGQDETTGLGEAISLPINSLINWYYSTGNVGASIYSNATGSAGGIQMKVNGALAEEVSNPSSAVNFLNLTGNTTGQSPVIQAGGSDTNVGIFIGAKGNSPVVLGSYGGGSSFRALSATSEVNYLEAIASATTNPVILQAVGSDTNISINLVPKGTGVLDINGSQIACSNLSNGATGCSTATGTSGATIPLLNSANTWSALQTFNGSDIAMLGTSTGSTTLATANTSASNYTVTLPANTGTVALTGSTVASFNAGTTGLTPNTATTGSVTLGGTLAIANGGTNATSFTAPASGINCIPFYNGTSLICDASAGDLGYNSSTDTVYTHTLNISNALTTVATFTNTGAYGALGGAGMIGYADAGAAVTPGSRLGFFLTGGAIDGSHTLVNPVGWGGFSSESGNYSASNQGGEYQIYTTPNGSTAVAGRRKVFTAGNDGAISIIGQLSSSLTTGTAPFSVASTTPVTNLSIGGNAATAGSATTATTATNLAGGAAGYIPYQSGAGATTFDGANFFWDATNHRLGIGTASPTSLLHTVDGAAKTTAYTGVLHSVTDTSSTASINKIGMDVESTGTWNGTSAVNTGLVVNATGGTTNYAATFSGGNVGIGTTSPASNLQVEGQVQIDNSGYGRTIYSQSGTTIWSTGPRASTDYYIYRESGSGNVLLANGTALGIGTATIVSGSLLTVAGTINQSTEKSCATGLTTDSNGSINGCVASDRSLKTNVTALPYDASLISKLQPVTYNWLDTDTRDTQLHQGFIAQDVQEVAPNAVVNAGMDAAGNPVVGIDANGLTAILTLEVQSLRERLDADDAIISVMKTKLGM